MNRMTLGLVLFLGACAVDDEALSTGEQAVSQLLTQRYTCNAYDECVIDLAPTTHACVLAGVKGGLGWYAPQNYGPVVVEITQNNQLHISNLESPSSMMVWTVCFAAPYREFATWHSDDAPTVISGGAYSGKRCFLSGVTNASSAAFNGLASFTHVTRTGDDHEITGTFPAGADVTVSATCTDIDLLSFHTQTNTSGAAVTTHLRADDGQTACALLGLGGTIN